MWNSLKTTTVPNGRQLPPPRNYKKPFRSQTLPVHSNDPRENDFDNRMNALGITNGPFRYEIRRGKTVPQLSSGQISPPADSDDSEVTPPDKIPPRNPMRHSKWRPASSIYDEAPPAYKTVVKDMYGRPTTAVEISPPSSPELAARRNGIHGEDISPIDEDPDMSQQQLLGVRETPTPPPHRYLPEQPRSHIPTARRDKSRRQNSTDASSRNPILQDGLRSHQNLSVQQPWEQMPPQHHSSQNNQAGFGLTTTVTGPKARQASNTPPSLGQRMRQFARTRPEPLDTRPPWNGASGRAPMIDPVQDDLTVEPLRLPRKSSKRVIRAGSASPIGPAGVESSGGAASAVRRLLPSRSNQKLKEVFGSSSTSDINELTAPAQHPYPSPPQVESPISQPDAPIHASQVPNGSSRLSPNIMNFDRAFKRKPTPSHPTGDAHHPHFSISSSVYPAQPEQFGQQFGPSHSPLLEAPTPSTSPFTPEDPWVQPPSRFSITTCNTVIPDSPDLLEEDRPPMPTPPPQLPSMMDRRRPVPGGDSYRSASAEPIIISMNTTYRSRKESLGQENSVLTPSNNQSPSIMTTDKALPLAPPELSSADDRVANLEARLENLAHRRTNINRSIKQMTELMPRDNLLASTDVLRKREVEKQKVEGLREELAEIQREEHDLGLKLHRAYKRLDRDGEFQSTTLWIRRVTH